MEDRDAAGIAERSAPDFIIQGITGTAGWVIAASAKTQELAMASGVGVAVSRDPSTLPDPPALLCR